MAYAPEHEKELPNRSYRRRMEMPRAPHPSARGFSPAKVNDAWDITNPLGLAALRPANGALEVVMAVLLFSSLVSPVVRFRRSQGREYQRMKWITYAAGTMFTMVVLVTVLDLIAANSALAKLANPSLVLCSRVYPWL
jgi:hypothetical protein